MAAINQGDSMQSALRLPPGRAFVWFTDVHSVSDLRLLARYESLLSADERQRHQAFHFDRDRHLYLVAHALLRTSLSRYADARPDTWTFSSQAFGRPEIADHEPPGERIRFNLSHTSGLAACVIARDVDVGIDVECLDRQVDSESIAPRYFAHHEVRQLAGLSGVERETRFIEFWTLKEAYVKARGNGLSMPLDRFHFQRDSAHEWRIGFADAEGDPEEWQFACLQPTARHVMSIAIHHRTEPRFDVTVREVVPLR